MDDNFNIALTAWGIWASVVVALVILWRQNRAARELTGLQIFLQLAASWESADMHNKRARLAQQLLQNRKSLDLDDSILIFFETLANMVGRHIVDRELVWSIFHVDLCGYWSAVKHYAIHARQQLANESLFAKMEALSNEFCHIGSSGPARTGAAIILPDDVTGHFLEWESRRAEVK